MGVVAVGFPAEANFRAEFRVKINYAEFIRKDFYISLETQTVGALSLCTFFGLPASTVHNRDFAYSDVTTLV